MDKGNEHSAWGTGVLDRSGNDIDCTATHFKHQNACAMLRNSDVYWAMLHSNTGVPDLLLDG